MVDGCLSSSNQRRPGCDGWISPLKIRGGKAVIQGGAGEIQIKEKANIGARLALHRARLQSLLRRDCNRPMVLVHEEKQKWHYDLDDEVYSGKEES